MDDPNEVQMFFFDLKNEQGKKNDSSGKKPKRSKLYRSIINIKMFAVISGLSNIPIYSGTIFLSSQLTSIEKHFGISSSKSAGIISANEIGFLLTALLFGYIFKNSHKPLVLGISNIVSAIASFICVLPFFFLHLPKTDQNFNANQTGSVVPLFPCMNLNASADPNMCTPEDKESATSTTAYALMTIGMILGGICKSVRAPLITCYLDDNIDKAYIGAYVSVTGTLHIIGFIVAFLLGGYFSQIYVTLEETHLTPMNPLWIGAWWLGFAVYACFSLLMALPLFAFPRSFKHKIVEEEEKPRLSIKDIAKSLLRMIRNHSLMLLSLYGILCIFNVTGKLTFLPKYYEIQFGWPAWKASIVIGSTYIAMFMFGMILSGALTSYFKVDILGSYRISVLVLFFHVFLSWLSFTISCTKDDIANTYLSSNSQLDVNGIGYNPKSYCLDCECSDYSLTCGGDGRTYRSPCHAGCQLFDMSTFQYSNCSCIGGMGTATYGACPTDCNGGLYITILTSLHSLLVGITTSPHTIIVLRSVLESDKGLAVAVVTFFCSIFGFFPAPPLFGTIIDHTCIIWNYLPCGGGRSSCKTYDNDKFRIRYFSVLGTIDIFAFLAVLIGAILSFRASKKTKKSETRAIKN